MVDVRDDGDITDRTVHVGWPKRAAVPAAKKAAEVSIFHARLRTI